MHIWCGLIKCIAVLNTKGTAIIFAVRKCKTEFNSHYYCRLTFSATACNPTILVPYNSQKRQNLYHQQRRRRRNPIILKCSAVSFLVHGKICHCMRLPKKSFAKKYAKLCTKKYSNTACNNLEKNIVACDYVCLSVILSMRKISEKVVGRFSVTFLQKVNGYAFSWTLGEFIHQLPAW